MDKVYIVTGMTGEYDEYTDWHVAAFLDEQLANDLCEQLNDWCKLNNVAPTGRNSHRWIEIQNPLDRQFQHRYSGTEYQVMSIELRT